MKTLLVCSQDLRSLRLGLVSGSVLLQEKDFLVEPDGYLGAVQQALRFWGVALTDLEKIVVVTGPGSFTGSRVSVTLVNGLAFALGVPVVGLANPARLDLAQLAPLAAAAVATGSVVQPLYDRPPHITAPTHR